MRPIERNHRLKEESYHGRVGVSFTACERNRRPGLIHGPVANRLVSFLEEAVEKHGCYSPAYCLMPDHLHVIIIGKENTSRPKDTMRHFKWLSGRWLQRQKLDLGWQKDFHDHILRAGEDWAAHARYILCNPCRLGLSEDVLSWPWSGSIGCDIDDVLWSAFS